VGPHSLGRSEKTFPQTTLTWRWEPKRWKTSIHCFAGPSPFPTLSLIRLHSLFPMEKLAFWAFRRSGSTDNEANTVKTWSIFYRSTMSSGCRVSSCGRLSNRDVATKAKVSPPCKICLRTNLYGQITSLQGNFHQRMERISIDCHSSPNGIPIRCRIMFSYKYIIR
jgi:hypothetical protein